MYLKNLKVSNFKTFKQANIDLDRFNILIGSNASGKSNFINILTFIKDISENGLNGAISQQGGIEYIRNIKIKFMEQLSIEINFISGEKDDILISKKKESDGFFGIMAKDIRYILKLDFFKKSNRYKSLNEYYEMSFDVLDIKDRDELKSNKKPNILDSGKVIVKNNDGNILFEVKDLTQSDAIKLMEIFEPPTYIKTDKKSKIALLELPTPLFMFMKIILNNLSVYDVDPKLAKKGIPIAGKTILEPNGENLAISLKSILSDKKKKKKFFTIIKDVLPFINEIDVSTSDRHAMTKLTEVYCENTFLPAYLISDGTINVSALIIALYFGQQIIIIEEPERNIHPYLISKIVSMMKDVSERQHKQIIVTTHNPEVVKYAGEKHIIIAKRDKDGFTEIYRPEEREEIKVFLENEMGVDELYIQNLL